MERPSSIAKAYNVVFLKNKFAQQYQDDQVLSSTGTGLPAGLQAGNVAADETIYSAIFVIQSVAPALLVSSLD
jgi:hypothetical protein